MESYCGRGETIAKARETELNCEYRKHSRVLWLTSRIRESVDGRILRGETFG